jgi:hypothetical protein
MVWNLAAYAESSSSSDVDSLRFLNVPLSAMWPGEKRGFLLFYSAFSFSSSEHTLKVKVIKFSLVGI